MTTPQGKFCWYECITPDVERAKEFYSELLGWTVEGQEMEGGFTYNLIKNGDKMIGGIITPPGPAMPPHWISYLAVDDVDASIETVKANGGSLSFPPMDMKGVGRMAHVSDPEGALFFLFKSENEEDTSDLEGINGWCWNELMCNDPDASLKFYEDSFGVAHDVMPMQEGEYRVLKIKGDEQGYAGIFKKPVPDAPTSWIPYVQVEDCDKTTQRAQSLGANVLNPPTDIPNVGRFAVLSDPTGATLCAITLAES